MPDIVTLGFEFKSANASDAIQKLIDKFDTFDNKVTGLKSTLTDVFNTEFVGILQGSSDAMKSFNASMKATAGYAKKSETSVKNLQTHIAELATDKIKPVPDEVIHAPTQYAANMKLASGELKNVFSEDLFSRIKTSKKELGKFNAGLVQTAKFAKSANEQVGKIPNLSKLNAETIKPIKPEVIANLREYAEVVRNASTAMGGLNKSAQGVKTIRVSEFSGAVQQADFSVSGLMETLKKKFAFVNFAKYLKQATDESVKFGNEIAHIVSLSQEFDAGKLRKEILNISSEFGDSTRLANATYYAYSSGVRGTEKQIASFTKDMGKLATLIRADVTPTVDAVTSAMNAYGLGVESAGELTDLFYGIVKQGKATGAQLASSMGQVIPTAANAGVSINEVGAAVSSLTKVMNTRNAITYFNNMLSKIIKPTKESALAARKFGIELGVTALKSKGFSAMMAEIQEKTQGSAEAISRIFPDLRGTRAAAHLLGLGWKDFNTQLEFFNNKAGIADEAMKTLSQDVNFQIGQIPNTVKKLRISFGELITDVLTLGGALTPVIAAFNNMSETQQKTVASIAAIGAGVIVLKTAVIGLNALRAVEIKSNEVLAAQHAREIKNRTALAAATAAQAKANAVSTAASGAGNIFSLLSGGTGVKGGFFSGFGREGIKALNAWRHLGKASKSINLLQGAMTLFGKSLGNLASLALKIFSPLNVFIGSVAFAAVGLIDVLNTKGATWKEKTYNSKIIGDLAKWLYNIFDDTIVMNERLQEYKRIAEVGEGYLMSLKDRESIILKEFSMDSVIPKSTTFDSVQEAFNSLLKYFASPELQNQMSEIKRLKSEIKKNGDVLTTTPEAIRFNITDAQRVLEGIYGKEGQKNNFNSPETAKKLLNKIKESVKNDPLFDIRGEINNIVQKYAKTWKYTNRSKYAQKVFNDVLDEKTKELTEQQRKAAQEQEVLKKQLESYYQKLEKSVAKMREAANQMKTMYKGYYDALQSVSATVEKVRFSMLSPEQQMKETEKSFAENMKKFYDVYKNDPAVAKAAFDKAVSAHNAIVQDAKRKLEKYQSFQKTLRGDELDAWLKATTSVQHQVRLLSREHIRLEKEAEKEKDLTAKYNLSKRSIEFRIQAIQKAMELRNRLAQSEREANARTLELIQSMDKFKSTAIDAVEANSVEALKLRARSFSAMPKFTPATGAQSYLSSAQASVRASYEKLAQLAETMRQQAAAREQQEQQRLDKQNATMQAHLTHLEEVQDHWQKQMQYLNEEMKKLAKTMQETMGSMEENAKKTADNTAKIANNTQKLGSPAVYPH